MFRAYGHMLGTRNEYPSSSTAAERPLNFLALLFKRLY